MVVEYVRYVLPIERAEAFEAAYAEARSSLDASPECLGYELSRCVEDGTSYVLRIEWESIEAHLEGFRKGPRFPGFYALVKPFFSEIAEMRHYAVTQVAAKKQVMGS